MNTSVATIERPSRVDAFVGEVLAPERRARIVEALPNHFPVERFEAAFRDAVMANPDLLKCDPREVYRVVHNVASTGLSLNPIFGEAWLVVGFSRKDGRHKPQARLGARGLTKLARQSGEITLIHAFDVRENDPFSVSWGDEMSVTHKPDVFGDRGPLMGFYATARWRTGETDYEFMSLKEVERIRDNHSDGWRAFKAGKIRSTPWSTDFDEMAKKTVLRRLLKRLPQSTELSRALAMDIDAPEEAIEKLSPPRGRPRLAAALEMAATPRPQEPPVPQPIPPQPEPEEEPEPEEDDGPTDEMIAQGEQDAAEGLAQLAAETAEMDPEREAVFGAGLAAAEQGVAKFRSWKAKQRPEELARLTQKDLAALIDAASGSGGVA